MAGNPEPFDHPELGQQLLQLVEVFVLEGEGGLETVDLLGELHHVLDLGAEVLEQVHDGVDVLALVVEVGGVEHVLQRLDAVADLRHLLLEFFRTFS